MKLLDSEVRVMNKLIFGRYIPGNSLIHQMDPRAKLVASFYFIGIIFLANNWQTYLLLAAFTFFAWDQQVLEKQNFQKL